MASMGSRAQPGHEHAQAGGERGLFDAAGHRHDAQAVQVVEDQLDGAAGGPARTTARGVVVLPQHFGHPLAGLPGHPDATVEHLRHGGHGDTGGAGDVRDGGAPIRLAHTRLLLTASHGRP
jgi:hypothetical protein